MGLALGEAEGIAGGFGEGVDALGAGLELADGEGEAEAAGDPTVSAIAPAGNRSRPRPPARLRATIVTLRRDRGRAATRGCEFTTL